MTPRPGSAATPPANTTTARTGPSPDEIEKALADRANSIEDYSPSVGPPPLSYQWRQRLKEAQEAPPAVPMVDRESNLAEKPLPQPYQPQPFLQVDGGPALGPPSTSFDSLDPLPLVGSEVPRGEAAPGPLHEEIDPFPAIAWTLGMLVAVTFLGYAYHHWRDWARKMIGERQEIRARAVMIAGAAICLIGLFLDLDVPAYERWYRLLFEHGGLAIIGALIGLLGLYFWLGATRSRGT